MKRVFGALGLCALAAAAPAADVLREISWGSLERSGALLAGEVRPADGSSAFEHLEVNNTEPRPRTLTLLELERPAITKARYAIVGEVRHEAVEGTAYLEMWSTFPQAGSFFSRTMAPSGPMKSLAGSSTWRRFALPFDAAGAAAPPQMLVVKLVLPGRGTVYLSPLRLEQYADGEPPVTAAAAWWGPRTAGLVGGVLGSFLGCVGALVGLLARRGKARVLAIGLAVGMLAFGAVSLLLGVVALLRSQPYEVFYPLLLVGVLCVGLPAFLLRTLRRRYQELELRKMRARDLSARHPA